MKKVLVFISLFFISTIVEAQVDTKTTSPSAFNFAAISVTIGGDFIVTGSFPALVTDRADQFVTRIYNEAKTKALSITTDEKVLKRILEEIEKYSLRNITLKRAGGETLIIDLEKFRINGDLKNNPYLKNDDVLIFSSSDLEKNFFSIYGAVNKPGKYQYVKGDKLSDAIEFALGLSKAYDNISTAEIHRLKSDGEAEEIVTVNIRDDFMLKPGDRIRVMAEEFLKKDYKVLVIGEVNYPGYIPISKSRTTVDEVIKLAGGFKETADVERARLFTGTSVHALLEKQFGVKLQNGLFEIEDKVIEVFIRLEQMMMYRMSNLTIEDTAYFSLENQLRILTEGSNIDFSSSISDTNLLKRYRVRDGDLLIIPQKTNLVYVFGQVAFPGYVNYKEGMKYKYYIDQAGGYGEYADDEVMIIKNGSRMWISAESDTVKIESGDYVWIPRVPARSFKYYLELAGNYMNVIGGIATILLLILQFTK